MRNIIKNIICTCCVLFLTACTTNLVTQKRALVINDPNSLNDKKTSIPIDLRLSHNIKGGDGKIYICDQPMPDVARADLFGSSGKAGFTLDQNGVLKEESKLEGGVNSATSVLQLNGRSSAVLLARDLMYQMCLSTANGTYENQAPLFEKIFGIVTAVAEKEQKVAETNQLAAQALILRPKIIQNNQTALSGMYIYGLAMTYHECLTNADSNKEKVVACRVNLKQKINQKTEGE